MADPRNPNNDPDLPGYDPNEPTVARVYVDTGDPVDRNVQKKDGAISNPGGGSDALRIFANIALGASVVFLVGSILYVIFAKPEAA